MNNHQKRNTINFIFSILVLGLMALSPVSAQSDPVYYGMFGRGDTSNVVKIEPRSFYADGILSIPSIFTHYNKMSYYSTMLYYDPAIDAYKLMGVNEVPLNEDIVEQVDPIVTSEQPIQVFLKLSGYFNYSCGNVLIVYQEKTKDMNKPQYLSRFEVTVAFYNRYSGTDNAEPPCISDNKLYTLVFPLQVYGLAAGTYEYAVNGAHTGTFELKSKNVVSEN